MTNTTVTKQPSDGLFFYLLLLTGFFLLLEISFFIECNRAYLSDYTFVSDHLSIPATILPGIFYFIFWQLTLHLLFCMLVWFVVKGLLFELHQSGRPFNDLMLAICVWILFAVTVLLANQHYYPNSKFAEWTTLLLPDNAFSAELCRWLINTCAGLIVYSSHVLLNRVASRYYLKLGMLAAMAGLGGIFYLHSIQTPKDIATIRQPNVIIVGIDSLRPDFLSFFGADQATPFIDSFLNSATVFAEAITPLARTYPSWVSILTGQYPRESGVRSNLADQSQLHLEHTLPAILQRNGYETIYATDETRFSNIDHRFGFNQVVSPPMGLNDFLLGNFNDFPLSNLLSNTLLTRFIFPHTFANRPVYFTYHPNQFIEVLKQILNQDFQKPLFLAVHFCLPHHPYSWASESVDGLTIQARYAKSIQRVDRQVRDFFESLRATHRLDHAIVVLLSDHGEALAFPGDRITDPALYVPTSNKPPVFYPPSTDHLAFNQSAGHGTDVMGLPQYHSLLAFKRYGLGAEQATLIPGTVTLLDIKPTILSLLQLPIVASSGVSLAKIIESGKMKVMPRHLFLESDFSPEAIRTVFPDQRKVFLQGIDVFEIDPISTRLTVKASMEQKIIRSKQYADIFGEWMLALYPQNDRFRLPILINLKTGQWTTDLATPLAKDSPAELMLAKLKSFYGTEINQVQ